MIALSVPLARAGAVEAANPIQHNHADYTVTGTDGANTANSFSSMVPITGTMTPIMVSGIHSFSNPDARPLTPHLMPDVQKTDVAAIGDGSPPAATATTITAPAPAPTASFQGLHTTVDCTVPPDSDGAVGPTYYAAFVNNFNNCATQTPSGNVGFYCKAASGGACTGQGILAVAFYYPNLFSNLTTTCNLKTTHSDPQLVYDSVRDRYLIVDITTNSPYQLCVAATLSNDPVGGSYCAASYAIPVSGLPDYDKAGIWIDGFYVSYNPSGDSRTVVFNKDDLEACRTVRTQDFDMGSDTHESDNQCTPQPNHIFRPNPATYSIFTSNPATGEPEFIVASYCLSSSIYVFTLHVDWSSSANSLLTRARIVTQTQNFAPSTVSSPANPMDTLRLHTMVPAPYFKDNNGNEYVWTTITTRGSSSSLSAIAWYQFKVVNNLPGSTTVANQNIWNPDSTSRLQAAASFDRQGDVLMDYTQVSSSLDPAVAYAGRIASDPANTLGQTETILFRGSSMGSGACGNQSPCHRWGDYSSNFIDPDGCTFWFTHEYYAVSDLWQWDTRIGATKYSSCTPLTYGRSVSPTLLSYTSSGIGIPTTPQNVTVTNMGTGPLVIQAPNITGTNPGDFRVSFDNCLTATAGIATTCTIQVTCTPSASGTRIATLNIMTNIAAADNTPVSLSCTALASPNILTFLSASTINAGQSVTDSATLSNATSNASGTVQYEYFNSGTCSGTATNVGSPVTVTNAVVPTSPLQTFGTAGSYGWKAVYSGDSNNNGATSSCEPLTVNSALTAPAISASPTTIDSGQSSTISTTSSFSGGTPTYTCQWLQKAPGASSYSNLGSSLSCSSGSKPTTSTGALITLGTWSFELQVTDSSGTPVTVTSNPVTVTVNSTLVASFTVSGNLVVGTSITFIATVSGGTTPYSFAWNFGDNSTGTGNPVTHSYNSPGNYTVTLRVTDATAAVAVATALERVSPMPPVIPSFRVSTAPAAGFQTTFNGTATGGNGGYGYMWSFGDGSNATGQNPRHVYSSSGNYTVTVKVTDSSGNTGSASKQVIVIQNPDVDGDGIVDIVDVAHIAFIYGSTSGSANYVPRYDLNSDGKIDILDIALVAFYYGRTVGT